MRVAVVSDIHGNLHALDAVLAAVDAERPDELWCLGDVVGYGPRPNECCETIARRADVSLVGNHDLGVLGHESLEAFADDAAAAARWTRDVLTEASRTFLEALAPVASREGVGLYHGSPRDPVWEYVLSAEVGVASLLAAPERLVLVGHSHVALEVGLDEGTVRAELAPPGTEVDLSSGRWLLNPGSVGQPRDGDPAAAFLLLDLRARRALFRRVPYPIERTQEEIRAAGLPESLAQRLGEGL